MPLVRDSDTGRFKRTIKEWSKDNWDDGFFNNKGRFVVYKPSSANSFYQGYALRSYVVYEFYSGNSVPKGYVIHHFNGDKTDDRFGNLEILTKKTHDELHRKLRIKETERICINCNNKFMIKTWRLNQKDHNRGKFCSLRCYFKKGGRWHEKSPR